METPIYDFLMKYSKRSPLRAHMPGHKGVSPVSDLEKLYSLDITEISGADSLFEADGIIKKSEENASRLYNTVETVYSCGGSTLCIQAMLHLMKQENRCVIAMRTVHRAFLNACILLGIEIIWIYPQEKNGILSGSYSTADFEKAVLKLKGTPFCIYVTSPDYLGNMADISALAKLCHAYDSPLLVDNAHGAHLAFMQENIHPMALGADLCCDSAHKMLPCLTGCAYLHTSNDRYRGRLKGAMSMFGSTSPSYLMLMSLDLCNRFLAEKAEANISMVCTMADKMKKRLSYKGKYIFMGGKDPLHVVIDAAGMGADGRKIANELEKNGCFPEYAGRDAVVLLLSASERAEDIERMERILQDCSVKANAQEAKKEPPSFPKPKSVMDMRSAALGASEVISVNQAEGRICAGVRVPCPPAVPIVISGEMIDKSAAETLKYYGIETIEVIKSLSTT